MAVKLNSELAAFFETGDQPSETEFGHLIDSILHSSSDEIDTDFSGSGSGSRSRNRCTSSSTSRGAISGRSLGWQNTQ